MDVGLYINDTKVDLYGNETVHIKDTLKMARDIGSIFTAYTQQFSLPASKTNNKLFLHWYSMDVVNGFDSRRKHTALITLSEANFKKGYIKLLSVDVEDNKPINYKVQFFGELTSLKDQLGEDKLSSLSFLDRYNHEFDSATVIDGFEQGLAYSGGSMIRSALAEVVYPFISHTRGFQFDTNGLYDITQTSTPTSNDRLDYTDLKPGIKVTKILDAIEDKYDLTFGGQFIKSDVFNELYLWCHKNKGGVSTDDPNTNLPEWVGDIEDLTKDSFTPSAADDPGLDIDIFDQDDGLGNNDDWDKYVNVVCNEEPADVNNQYHILTYDLGGGGQRTYYSGTLTITPSGSFTADYNVFFYSEVLNRYWVQEYDQSGTQAFNFSINESQIEFHDLQFKVTSSALDEFDIDLDISGFRDSLCTAELTRVWSYTKTVTSAELITEMRIPYNMPEMKVIDFMRTLFKTFNLVAYDSITSYLDRSYEIILEPLNDYYDSGNITDITKYVEITKSTVNRVAPYRVIKFKYEKPKTFLTIQGNELTQREFGNAEFDTVNLGLGGENFLFDGGEYSVNLKAEKVQFERITNGTTSANSQIQWGWFVNDFSENDPEPELGSPLFFFVNNRSCSTDTITWKDTTVTNTTYNAPGNVNADQTQTLHFGEEFDEYTAETNENSLFSTYYQRQIEAIFDRDARRLRVTTYLPLRIIYNYEMKDKWVIGGVPFNAESIEFAIDPRVQGFAKAEMDLLKITGRKEEYDIVPPVGTNYLFEDGVNFLFENSIDPGDVTDYQFND